MGRTLSCFNGEFLVSKSGIYTHAHWYRHPKSGREVLLVGTNHIGDRECYEYINTLLKTADIVLHESSGSQTDVVPSEVKKQVKEDARRILAGEMLDLYSILGAFFNPLKNYFKLPGEGDVFDRSQDHWQEGDADFFDQLRQSPEFEKNILKKLQRGIKNLDKNDVRQITNIVRAALKKMNNRTFTKKDFGFAMAKMWSIDCISTLFVSTLANPRDKIVVEKIEQIFKKQKNVLKIGVIFGAAHIHNLCYLLERRGFMQEHTEKLCSMRF